jgi:hypothetical protein
MSIQIKRPTRDVNICTDLEILNQFDQNENLLRDAMARQATENSPEVDELVAKQHELEDQMARSQVTFHVQALTHKRYAEITAAHPAREDNEADKQFDFNTTQVLADLMPPSIMEVTGPDGHIDFDPETDWPGVEAQLTDGQYQTCLTALIILNERNGSAPKSPLASRRIQSSANS